MRLRPITLTVLLLIGCDRGGSSGPPPLRVATQTPASGSIVDVDARVAVVFDRAPDPATLTPIALQVLDGSGPLPGLHSYDGGSRTWTWTANGELPRGALLTVQVADSVRSLDGSPLQSGPAWTFRVRAGVAAAPVTIRTGIVLTSDLFVAPRPDGSVFVVGGSQSWSFGVGGVGAAEVLPVVAVRAVHTDGAGGLGVLGAFLVPSGPLPAGFARRAPAGGWSPASGVVNPATGLLVDVRMHGNERGDFLLHAVHDIGSSSFVRHVLFWSSVESSTAWLQPTEWLQRVGRRPLSTLDGSGRVATLRVDGDFVLVDRGDPGVGTMLTHTVAQVPFPSAEALACSRDGSLRAIWREPGVARQSFSSPGGAFGPAVSVPVGIPSESNWRCAPTGALVGWKGASLFRSEAGSVEWSTATLPAEPLTVAISPRGEAAFLYFQLPDQLMLVRWRAGEPIDSPLSVASVPSAFAAARRGALSVDDAGRVVVAFVPDIPGDLTGIRIE